MRLFKTRKQYNKVNGLPRGYTQLEYLQSSGTQWIDTGITGDETTKWVLTAAFNASSGNSYTGVSYGDVQNPVNNRFGIGVVSSNWYCGLGDTNNNNIATSNKNLHVFTLDAVNKKFWVDSTSYNVSYNTFTYPATIYGGICLFARMFADTGAISPYSTMQIRASKIYQNDVLVSDLVPCLDNNNVACMFDRVTRKTFYNKGTGNFTYGKQIIPIEYLESTTEATQQGPYINTGINYFADFEVGVKLRSNVSNKTVLSGQYYCVERNNEVTGVHRFSNGMTERIVTNALITEYHALKWKDNKTYIDGEFFADFNKTTQTGVNLTIFGYLGSSNKPSCYPSMIYFFKVWDTNGNLIRDYIPVRDNNNVGYLFDQLNSVLYNNVGSGSFVLGDDIEYRNVSTVRFIRDRVLPKGFTEVEYLQTTGTQKIDTGIYFEPTKEFEAQATYSNPDNSKRKMLIGDYEDTTHCSFSLEIGASPNNTGQPRAYVQIATDDNENSLWGSTLAINKPHTISQKWSGSTRNQYLTYNGTTVSQTRSKSIGLSNPSGTIKLFLDNRASSTALQNPVKLYSAWIKKEGVLVRDFIPCLDSNNIPCLYDRVSGTAFYNIGSGNFTYGRKIYPVEYLESTGTQYIDTGLKPTGNTTSTLKFMHIGSSTSFAIIGARGSTWSVSAYSLNTNAGKFCFNYGNNANATQVTTSTLIDNNIHTAVIGANGECKFDSEIKSLGSYTFTCPVNLILFGSNNNGTNALTPSRIYHCTVQEGSTLIRDYVPAIDENGVGFMFDKANHVAYLNAGTDSFSYGKKILNVKDRYLRDSQIPSIYKQVNYIQSTGTQYIDTGVKLTSNHSVEIDFQLTESPQHRTGIYGGLCNVNNVSSSDDYGRFGVLTHYQNNYFEGGYGYSNTSSTIINIGNQDINRHTIKQEKAKTYFDNSLKKTFPTATFTMGLTAYLGGFNYVNYTPAKAKYYSFKVWNNTTLVRDFVPVIRKRDSKPGMYDRVNGDFYINVDSGVDFNYG